MRRHRDPVALGSTWDHLPIRPVGRLLTGLVLNGFLATLDRDRQALLTGQRSSVRPTIPAITVVDPPTFAARILRDGALGFGEAFIEGAWRGGEGGDDLREETDEVVDWLAVYAEHLARRERRSTLVSRLAWRWRLPRSEPNSADVARRNAALHYDLPIEFFHTFLDDELVYSCADFRQDDALEKAQAAKICALLDLAEVRAGGHILDIGCGWGALLARAATDRDLRGTGITVSRGQLEFCRTKLADLDLTAKVEVLLEDYRDHRGSYDAVISVEMLEAVGAEYWAAYFRKIDSLLRPGGTAVVQAITFPDARMRRSLGNYSWVDRYIFPGGELISVQEVERLLSRVTSLEVRSAFRLSWSYSRTLREWRNRFCANLDAVRALGFDDKFIRVWALYLAYFEAGFRSRYMDVWQLQLKARRPSI